MAINRQDKILPGDNINVTLGLAPASMPTNGDLTDQLLMLRATPYRLHSLAFMMRVSEKWYLVRLVENTGYDHCSGGICNTTDRGFWRDKPGNTLC
jgi:hypothetical protein